MRLTRLSLLAALATTIGCATEAAPAASTTDEASGLGADTTPTGRGLVRPRTFQEAADRISNQAGANIRYHGGPLITGTPGIYYIWYGGQWSGNTATTILTDFAKSLGSSPYENILQTYTGGGKTLTGDLAYKGEYTTSAYLGTSLSDGQIFKIVNDAITKGNLPYDASGIYFVLTSKEVNASSGFCSQYCGWHQNGTSSKGHVRYAFVGNPDRCPSSCAAQTTSPNGNAGADGMASIIAHESEETISDPDGTGFYFSNGEENGDRCAWTFGKESTASNGSKYNVTLGGKQYLIQQDWDVASASCKLAK